MLAGRLGVKLGKKELDKAMAVRAHPGWFSALSIFHSKSILYRAFVWACRALNIQKWGFRPGQKAEVVGGADKAGREFEVRLA